jgi:hypothetical protein
MTHPHGPGREPFGKKAFKAAGGRQSDIREREILSA